MPSNCYLCIYSFWTSNIIVSTEADKTVDYGYFFYYFFYHTTGDVTISHIHESFFVLRIVTSVGLGRCAQQPAKKRCHVFFVAARARVSNKAHKSSLTLRGCPRPALGRSVPANLSSTWHLRLIGPCERSPYSASVVAYSVGREVKWKFCESNCVLCPLKVSWLTLKWFP